MHSQPNLSGNMAFVRIRPGGRQGDEISTSTLKSVVIVGRPGLRLTFCVSDDDDTWQDDTWRAVVVTTDGSFVHEHTGRNMIRVPDLDRLDHFEHHATNRDRALSYDYSESLDDRRGWTYGRHGGTELKGNVKMIRIDKIPKDQL